MFAPLAGVLAARDIGACANTVVLSATLVLLAMSLASIPHVLSDEQAALVDECVVAGGAKTLGSLLVAAGKAEAADHWFDREPQIHEALVLALQQV